MKVQVRYTLAPEVRETPSDQRARWLKVHGIDLWKAQAMAQFQGLLPEFERAMRSSNLPLLRAMQTLCERRGVRRE